MPEPILGAPKVSVATAKRWAAARGATSTFEGLADLYWGLADEHGDVRPEVAYAQAAKETGFGRFGGVLDESYRNPCGLKTPRGGGDHAPQAHTRFNTWADGVSAHLDHLALYAGAATFPRATTKDPRHFPSLLGVAEAVEDLEGKWATDPGYGASLASLVRSLTGGGGPIVTVTDPHVSKLVQAKHFTPGPRRNPIRKIVIHTMEAPEKGTTAESIAAYFARGEKVASAHYCIDSDTIVRSVRNEDIAYHAPGANHDGIGYEHFGYARQTAAEWADPASQACLALSAKRAAVDCVLYGIPITYLDERELLADVDAAGITTHHDVSQAFKRSSHWDPGPAFPMTAYLEMVEEELMDIAKAVVDEMERRMDHREFAAGRSPLRAVYTSGLEDRTSADGVKRRNESTDILERLLKAIAANPGKPLEFHGDGTLKTIDGQPVE